MEEVNKNSRKKWEGESEADRKASRQKTDKMKTERRKEKTIGDGAGHQSKEKDDNQGKRIRELVYRLRIWMVLFAALISVYMGSRIWKEYRDSIISQQKEQMYLNVRSLRDNLRLFISECIADLDGLHRLSSAQREENQELLEDYVGSHSRFVYDVCLEESDQLLYSTRGSKIEKVYSDSRIDETKNLMLAQLNDGKMYLVLRAVLENGNSLSMVIRLEEYYQAMIENLRIGTSGYVVVKDSSGIILMHPEQQQWGIDVIEGRMSMYPELNLDSLSQMIDHQKQGQEGTEEYYSYWWTKEGYPRGKKICAYAPAWIGEDFLIVSEVIDYDDIYHPIVSGALKLFGFCFFIFSMLAVMAMSMLQMVWQRKQDTRQIAYLTELNRILEDMHRSEETIAHQQRLQIMGTMTGGIAHEFNNLLTPIMGYADLLMMELPEDSEQKEYAMEIYEAAEKAKDIVRQISSLSRKNMETVFKNEKAERLITRAMKMVRSVCPAHVHLEQEICLNGECILCNETQLNQVILNICVNSVHAIGHNPGILRVTARTVATDQIFTDHEPGNWERYLCLEFQDNGCGMSSEVKARMFDPFFTTKRGGKGTGLGLALVEQIVASHKGFVEVESTLGEGTLMSVYLPVSEQKEHGFEEAELTEDEEGIKAQVVDRPTLSLLAADDNPKVLGLLERDAERLSVILKGCMSMEEAEELLKNQENKEGKIFDVLAMEQEIGGKSAVDFCMSIKGRYPELIKILMIDQVTREVAEAKRRHVIDGYIEKPASLSAILEEMRRNLNEL